MIKKILLSSLLTALFLIALFNGWARDVTTFVNMGFSIDEKFFLFGQYGYDEIKGQTYAQASLVDVVKNTYVPNGFQENHIKSTPQSGNTLDGAFLELIEQLASLRKQYKINYTNKGRLIYASSIMRESARTILSQNSETLKFRDFQTNNTFNVTLNQNISSHKKSTFYIDLNIAKDGGVHKNYKIGNPQTTRSATHYEIDKIIISPNQQSLILVIAMHVPSQNNSSGVRYMVEAVKIDL